MDKLVSRLLLIAACSSTAILALIALFIFKEGVPLMVQKGVGSFLFGREWSPLDGQFGLLPFIVGSLWITFGALLLGVPLGVAGRACSSRRSSCWPAFRRWSTASSA
jgi:phosphate transport system permease protein